MMSQWIPFRIPGSIPSVPAGRLHCKQAKRMRPPVHCLPVSSSYLSACPLPSARHSHARLLSFLHLGWLCNIYNWLAQLSVTSTRPSAHTFLRNSAPWHVSDEIKATKFTRCSRLFGSNATPFDSVVRDPEIWTSKPSIPAHYSHLNVNSRQVPCRAIEYGVGTPGWLFEAWFKSMGGCLGASILSACRVSRKTRLP
jgi:hypothetical protein